jgi:hypothetical protein
MVIDAAKIAQMELALEQARAELQRQNGVKFEMLWVWLSDAEKERFHDSLTRKQDRVLFGLEAPERTERPAKSGGDLACPICGKTGLTPRGLALHKVRKHKGEQDRGEETAMFATEKAGMPRRRGVRGGNDEEMASA